MARPPVKTHRRRAAALAVAVVATLALAAYALASATVTQTLSLAIKGKTSGKKPGAVAMKITEESVGPGPTDLERVPPKLDTATIKFDKRLDIDTKGLPTCKPSKLENTDDSQAKKACKDAIVGKGFALAKIVFPDQDPIDAPAPVTAFNGKPQGGKPVFLIHAYTTVPAPTTFIVPGAILKSSKPFGRQLTLHVPPIAGGAGSLVHFDVNVKRKWKYKGEKHSYVSGKCKGGQFAIEGTFDFGDGSHEVVPATDNC
jgi:hypothetical protein